MTTSPVKTAKALQARHIHLRGKVQGVGFRPFVYRLARKYGLAGWVNNGMDGVHIEVEGEASAITNFYRELLRDHPEVATITAAAIREIPGKNLSDFAVIDSSEEGPANVLILPDLDMCPDCRAELQNPADRRYRYPFITCTNCGPRYSIMTRLPYDRPNTHMAVFTMCGDCQAEYTDPADRRFYSETNSCPECGIRLQLLDAKRRPLAEDDSALAKTVAYLREGKIVAVKGIGGYLLLVDAGNQAAVAELRRRKHRPSKPFALMYPDLAAVRQHAMVSDAEARMLQDRAKPIVLLQRLPAAERIAAAVAPGQETLGIMLPYTPLHFLLLEQFGEAAVATSANISGSPILSGETQVFALLGEVADAFLVNNREIAVPQDDSVVRLSPYRQVPIILRRSRSYAPIYPHNVVRLNTDQALLALGAQLKSTVALTHCGNIYVSQYLGDLENYETEQNYQTVIRHLLDMLNARPEFLVADAHPQYTSTRIGEELGEKMNRPLRKLQHHRAHFWALLGENRLLNSDEPILGVIWDGTGWGDDQAIWGSEFFRYQAGEMERVAHLAYYPLLLGDKAAREPRLPALALWGDHTEAEAFLEPKFSAGEYNIYRRFLEKGKFHSTSSMGRLFDALASLLGLADKVTFEGEAAMLLENAAFRYAQQQGFSAALQSAVRYPLAFRAGSGEILLDNFLTAILTDLRNGEATGRIAFSFHLSLAALIVDIAGQLKVRRIGVSGGVFQNGLLLDLLKTLAEPNFQLLFHRDLSPNDENIAFGQLVWAAWQEGWIEADPEKDFTDTIGDKHI